MEPDQSGEGNVLASVTMRYQHVIWDWNGTLFDDTALCVEIMGGMLATRGLDGLDEERYREVFTFPVRDYYERLGFDFAQESFDELAVEFHDGYLGRWRERSLRADALHVSDSLHERGVTQSILSVAEQMLLDDCADHFGLTERMTALVGTEDYRAFSKIDHGLVFLRQLHVPVERVLLIGDTAHDHEVATAMGIDSALVDGGHATRDKLAATGAPVFESLTSLLAAVG